MKIWRPDDKMDYEYARIAKDFFYLIFRVGFFTTLVMGRLTLLSTLIRIYIVIAMVDKKELFKQKPRSTKKATSPKVHFQRLIHTHQPHRHTAKQTGKILSTEDIFLKAFRTFNQSFKFLRWWHQRGFGDVLRDFFVVPINVLIDVIPFQLKWLYACLTNKGFWIEARASHSKIDFIPLLLP